MPFVLISPDGCSVRQKALYAQLAGASVAIIYGDTKKLADDAIVSHDGRYYLLSSKTYLSI
jgi:hypothetical protein